jgi:hypothetical protein
MALKLEVGELTKERDRLNRELHGTPGYTSVEGLLIDAKMQIQMAKAGPDPVRHMRVALECVITYLDKGGHLQ